MFSRLTVILALPLLCVACGKDETATVGRIVHLPGFDIRVPAGAVVKSTRHPASGSHHVQYGFNWNLLLPEPLARYFPSERGAIKISWRAGAMTAQDLTEHQQMMKEMLVGIATKTKRSIAINEQRWVDTMTRNGKPLSMGYAYCEPGLLISVVATAAGEDAADPTRRIVESIACQVGDTVPSLPDPNLNLPAHFGRALVDDSAVYISPQGVSVSATHSHGDLHIDGESLRRLLQNASMQIFETDTTPELALNEIKRADAAKSMLGEILQVDSQPRTFVATLYCADVDFTVLAFMQGAQLAPGPATELAKRIDCSFAPQHMRSLSEVFGEACAGGDAQACADLSAYVEEGSALADHGTAAELRARACALGATASCTRS